MLTKEEIRKIAEGKNEAEKIIEKDYLLEILMFIIQETTDSLAFKGGTALYKLHSLNRFSEDLDFTLTGKLDVKKFSQSILRKLQQGGFSCRIKEIISFQLQDNLKFEIKGPLFDGNITNLNVVSINISKRENLIYLPKEERIYPKYRDIPSFTIRVMVLEEILAEKIRALFTRQKPRDLYDIWFLLNKGIKPEIGDINRKLKIYKEKFNKNKMIEKIEEKRKSWHMDLRVLIKGNLPDFELVKNQVLERF